MLATSASASVFYAFNVLAETGTNGFVSFGNGPSINDKGKVAFVSGTASGPSVMLWSPVGGLSNLATTLLSPNRSFGDSARINSNDEVLTWNRLLPLGLYEVRVFRSATPNDSSIMVRGLTSGLPYDLLYQNPAMNNTRVLEDRSSFISTGNKDGVCDAGEVCVSQIAFNAFRATPARYLGTVVQNPTNAADVGVRHEFGLNTSQSRPMMADDGRIVVRGVNPTDQISLFNYALGSPTTIAGSGNGFTALGAASGITPDGKVIAFAGNRGHGDGIFLSIELAPGQRRLVRIVGENATIQKSELGLDGNNAKLYMQSIELDSRVGVVYTPDADGVANKSVVVSFIGTPNAAGRTNPGTGRPFLFSAQKGLWTIRIDLEAPLFENVCVIRAPGVTGNPFTVAGDDHIIAPAGAAPYVDSGVNGICESENTDSTETLFSRSSPIPVVQIGDTIKSTGVHTVSAISVNDPVAPANYDGALIPRAARNGDHRVVFWAAVDADAGQMIVAGEHLDSDQDGLLDHWETTGIDLDGTGNIDLDLPAMGANPFRRDFFIQMDWEIDRAIDPPAIRGKHQPAPGVLRRLEQFYAAAPATLSGIPAGIQLHVDAGPGFDTSGQFLSRKMGSGPLRGGTIVSAPGNQPIDILYFRSLGAISLPGVNAVDFDTLKNTVFWSHHRGAREFAFTHVVMADFHHAVGPSGGSDNATPIVGTATGGSSFTLEHQDGPLTLQLRGHAIKITAGTGAGQMRTINDTRTYNGTTIHFVQVDDAWVTPSDATSQYIILHGSGGEGRAGFRDDGAFSPGKNLAVTLAGYGRSAPGNTIGSFVDQWKTLAHEIGHLTTLPHGGSNHNNYKTFYVSLMNYAYSNCVAPKVGADAAGTPLLGGFPCPIDDYSRLLSPVFDDWRHVDLRSALNFQVMGQAFGAPPDPPNTPFTDVPIGRTIKEIIDQNGPRDTQGPTVLIGAPAGGAAFALGSTIPVSFTATDDTSVTNAEVLFDVNGDGSLDEATEVFPAVHGVGNTYTATIPAVSGPAGSRRVSAVAYDPARNPGSAFVIVNVGSVPAGTIPGGVGQTEEAAIAGIEAAGFSVGSVTLQQSASVPAGSVISQNPPAGQSLPPGTVVSLVISMGANGVVVPNVVGLTQAAATGAITGGGLALGTVTQDASPPGPTLIVIAQAPLPGQVAASGSPVNLFVTNTSVAFTLDVDASLSATKYDALTDGLLVIRYLFGLSGTSLTNGALGGTATRTDPAVIKTYLDGNLTSLDIDGNGTPDALTDGLLILRYMFGLRGSSLIAGAFDPLGTRTTAPAIETYIQSLMP